MKKSLFLAAIATIVLLSACAEKQVALNGVICPAGKTQDRIKADFEE